VIHAAVYLRQSLDRDGNELGITRQREDCLKLAADKGWAVAGIYPDNDISASSGKRRPEYERMLSDIREGGIGAVLVWDLDRLHRRPIELEAFMALADDKHLALATVSGDVDLSTAQGRLVARLKGSVAAHEIEHKVARQRRAARQKAERGRPQWKRAFGYLPDTRHKQDDDGTREPDPATAPLVRDAYAAILAGASLTDICRLFNDAGAYGLTGKPWTHSTMSLFLRAPRNAGLRSHTDSATGQTEIVGKGTWPGLVDESTWRAVQAKLTDPGRAPGPKSVRKHRLTGMLRCGNCGDDIEAYLSGQWVMHPTGGKSGRPKAGQVKEAHPGQTAHSIAYQCKRCRRCGVRAHHVEPLLQGLVAGRLAKPDAVDLLKKELHDAAEAEAIRDEKHALYGRLDELAVERAQGMMTGRQLQIATEVIQQQIDALERKETDQERLRVFDGIPLGTDDAIAAVEQLSADRFRAVMSVLMRVTIMPKGKSGNAFDPERVKVEWL
jgi:DNA invertase Pin-like site-specific DNA recombinase